MSNYQRKYQNNDFKQNNWITSNIINDVGKCHKLQSRKIVGYSQHKGKKGRRRSHLEVVLVILFKHGLLHILQPQLHLHDICVQLVQFVLGPLQAVFAHREVVLSPTERSRQLHDGCLLVGREVGYIVLRFFQ